VENALIFTPIGILSVLGFFSGLVWRRYRLAPAVATGLIVLGYLTLLAVTGLWVLDCRDCTAWISDDSSRVADLYVALVLGGFVTAGIIAVTWLGALLSSVYSLLLRRRPYRPA